MWRDDQTMWRDEKKIKNNQMKACASHRSIGAAATGHKVALATNVYAALIFILTFTGALLVKGKYLLHLCPVKGNEAFVRVRHTGQAFAFTVCLNQALT